MNFRFPHLRAALLPPLALATVVFAQNARAEGTYQQTKDGKTLVWNSEPHAGDTATWVGDRSREGYASGFGTLTWYTTKGDIYARYYAHMLHGKFDGPVNAHSKGKTAHATFADGKRLG